MGERGTVLEMAEAAALHSATRAGTVYEELTRAPFRPDIGAPLRGGVPVAPLVDAVGDLAATAYATARAIHFAVGATPVHQPAATSALAAAVEGAVELAIRAAGHRHDEEGARLRVDLAHAAARAAHSAAGALGGDDEPRQEPAGRVGAVRGPSLPSFPPSSRRLIELLSQAISGEAAHLMPDGEGDGGRARMRIDAARAACDAARNAMRAYDRCVVSGAPMRLTGRVARLAARASAVAGFAALTGTPSGRPA
jgi:hypothetical protein